MNKLTTLEGKAWVCGDYTDCYKILPPQYWSGGDKAGSLDKAELSRHVMEDLDPLFAQKAADGEFQFIVSGKNFGGGGKSIEHPIIAIKGINIKAVIADSISRYFYRNAINNGLIVIVADGISQSVQTGNALKIDIDQGEILNITTGATMPVPPLVGIVKEIIQAGGYLNFTKAKMKKN